MRLFELLDNPLPYKLMQTRTSANEGSKDHVFGFRVGDYWYKVYVELYPMASLMDEEDAHGKELESRLPQDFVDAAEKHKLIMSVDFSQFDYGEKMPYYPGIGGTSRGPIPIGVGDERTGREGTGNEVQVFATVAAIAQEVFDAYEHVIGAIEYGFKQEDVKRGRLYDRLMRKFGVYGTKFQWDADDQEGGINDRVIIVV